MSREGGKGGSIMYWEGEKGGRIVSWEGEKGGRVFIYLFNSLF